MVGERVRRMGLLVAASLALGLLATMNAGGYRYGISDQAFHIPAIVAHLDPALFARDRPLLAAQDRLMLFDDGMAGLAQLTGVSLPALFVLGYAIGLLGLIAATIWFARGFYETWWGVAALGLALTLRHRITRTSANTLEAYLQPRMLAFAVGVLALAVFIRKRSWLALGLAGAAAVLHPTTGLWFALWIGVAVAVSDPRSRVPLLRAGAVAAGLACWSLLAGPLQGRLVAMDAAWVAVLASKDYLFPTAWPLDAWLVNLAYPILLVAVLRYRQAVGLNRPRETGLVVGILALTLVFLASLPLIAGGLAIAVQLQTSRVFWMADFLATAFVIWFLVESPIWARWGIETRRAGAVVFVVLACLAAGRGAYVMEIEHPERLIFQINPSENDWEDVMAWASQTRPDSHWLVDPGHAWKYGTSVRASGRRDVYLEEVKDAALAIYSRDVAMRVARRTKDLGDFGRLTAAHARELASRYDLDYLVSERPLDLPEVHAAGRFRVYALGASPSPP